jgi:phasin family protein
MEKLQSSAAGTLEKTTADKQAATKKSSVANENAGTKPAAKKTGAKTSKKASKKASGKSPKKAPKKTKRKARKKTAGSVKKAKKAAPRKTAGKVKTASAAKKGWTPTDTVGKIAFISGKQSYAKMEDFMTKGKTQFDKLAQDATSHSKEHMEAVMKSGNIFAKGFEDIMKSWVSLTQDATEKNTEAFKTLMGCKTLNELAEVQNKLAQEGFDDFMAGATKLSEMSAKLASEAFEPLNDQVSKAIRKASESMAA